MRCSLDRPRLGNENAVYDEESKSMHEGNSAGGVVRTNCGYLTLFPIGYALPGTIALFLVAPRDGSSKSGFELSTSVWRFTGSRVAMGGGGGSQRGFTPRCEMEVKVDRSDPAAGLRGSGGISRVSS